MDMALWIVQVVLGLAFIGAGWMHATQRDQATGRMRWMLDIPKPMLTTIGVLEILGGIGLVLPGATGVLPWLTPLAAAALVGLMLFAAAFHARRPGEAPNIAFNVLLGAVALFVAYGRFVIERF